LVYVVPEDEPGFGVKDLQLHMYISLSLLGTHVNSSIIGGGILHCNSAIIASHAEISSHKQDLEICIRLQNSC